jgi:hypothetical protein
MNLEMIQAFCHNEPEKNIGKPWTVGEFTYATDGFRLLRVPAIAGVDPNNRGVAITNLYLKAGPMPDTGWVDLPALPPTAPCPKCQGGKKPVCEECDGNGTVSLSNSYSTYDDIECASCGGTGVGEECPECWGYETVETEPEILIGGVTYKTYQIRSFKDLPGVQIAPAKGVINWIRFDGGDVLIMPIIHCGGF